MPNELEERARRSDALAQALCLLDSFAGEGLLHTYGNGQTIDAADACNELAAAFGIDCEPGWYRMIAAAFTQEAGWMPIEQAPTAYLKEWVHPADPENPRRRVDTYDWCEPWLEALSPTITPLFPLPAPPGIDGVVDDIGYAGMSREEG